MVSDTENDDGPLALFDDPEGYYPPTPPPTTQSHTLLSGETITLHLVGHSPLEAHRLWNGSRVIAHYFEASPELVRGRTVLELGAGAGLPSIVCAVLGARRVVVTDYPDPDLVQTMWRNIDECALVPKEEDGRPRDAVIAADGFVWGADAAPLLAHLGQHPSSREGSEPGADAGGGGFDVMILADLLFRHSEHGNMVRSIEAALRRSRDSAAYVFFTSYRPWLRHKDLAFFDVARERGFEVEKVLEKRMERAMFEDDPGDEEVRKTVLGFTVKWPADKCPS
ncbi:Protein N-terminal and lysine N-methyltransferase EFM7 [Pleurostoma richardsiae]|uniref:Protein N-terminal and lysine N-methyltransferase EFM7 n=1 Tax=Pleurostoma richardsiae TaxID=41990 RepID=A0AA38RN94_9PEZI|nr:Protein N-terminal and lysine N-methyltransferase EFM7 [Pleurostoma richardsiae]